MYKVVKVKYHLYEDSVDNPDYILVPGILLFENSDGEALIYIPAARSHQHANICDFIAIYKKHKNNIYKSYIKYEKSLNYYNFEPLKEENMKHHSNILNVFDIKDEIEKIKNLSIFD